MYRRGPKTSTPTSVQCQKCLKRERHYTYECKATAQERPYVPRPSRTQQLFNPKLVPKLTNESLPALEKKEGLADQILAKREGERAKKRLADDDLEGASASRRQRSASFDSVSTVSTNAEQSRRDRPQSQSRSPSPRQDRASRSRSLVHHMRRERSGSRDFRDSHSRRESRSPDYPTGGRSRSPIAHSIQPTSSMGRDHSPEQDQYYSRDVSPGREAPHNARRRQRSSSTSMSPPPQNRRRLRSRSPQQRGRRATHARDDRGRRSSSSPRHRGQEPPVQNREFPRRQQPRELSPFSARKALTDSINMQR